MTRSDIRTPFADAEASFMAFLESQGWPTDILWLTRDRVTGYRNRIWLFRPQELADDSVSRLFYESVRRTPGSIRLDGLCKFGSHTIAYVDDWGRDSRLLNFGVITSPLAVTVVQSQTRWWLIRSVAAILGESPIVKSLAIPPLTSAA